MPEDKELYEAANRTIQGRFLLQAGPELNEIARAVLARAQRMYDVEIVFATFMSNHFHLLILATSVVEVANFMGYFEGNLARKAGRLYDWSGPFWHRRYDIEPVDNDEEDQVRRLRYLIEQGCKENLVWGPRDWPGVTTVEEVTTGKPLQGRWLNQTRKYRSELKGEDRPLSDFEELEECTLVPLPCWRHLSPDEYRNRVTEIVDEIERETLERHKEENTAPRGITHVLTQDPHHRPNSVKSSPAPWIHARTREARDAYRRAYAWFLAEYQEASRKFRNGQLEVEFPPNCFLPRPPNSPRARAPA